MKPGPGPGFELSVSSGMLCFGVLEHGGDLDVRSSAPLLGLGYERNQIPQFLKVEGST